MQPVVRRCLTESSLYHFSQIIEWVNAWTLLHAAMLTSNRLAVLQDVGAVLSQDLGSTSISTKLSSPRSDCQQWEGGARIYNLPVTKKRVGCAHA